MYNFKTSYFWNILRFKPLEDVGNTDQDCHSKVPQKLDRISGLWLPSPRVTTNQQILALFPSYVIKELSMLL